MEKIDLATKSLKEIAPVEDVQKILIGALENGDVDKVRLAIQLGANVNLKSEWKNSSPLHYAAENGNPEVIEILLKYGADVNAINDDKKTPLHIVVSTFNLEAVKIMLKHGARTDLKDRIGFTPLTWAKALGFERAIALL